MKIISRSILTMLILTFITLALLSCESIYVPVSVSLETPQPLYAAAQSTLVYGQNQLNELSRQATMVGLSIAQAENAAEQATLDFNQRQLMDLAIRGTEVSQNMAQAAANQQFIIEQTQIVWNATATAQSQAATDTYSRYLLNVTQTAQAQAILSFHASETAQAVSALTAIPLTATPLAETQAAILFQQRKYERQSFWGEIVTPLKILLTTLIIILLITGGVLAFRRLMPVLEFRLRNPRRYGNLRPLYLMEGKFVDLAAQPNRLTPRNTHRDFLHQPPSDGQALVEILGPDDPSIINWITEAEQKLRANGRTQP